MTAFDGVTETSGVSPAFDGRFDRAAELIKTQRHRREEPLHEGGRWPISVTMHPDPSSDLSTALGRLVTEALAIAGPDHWRTGRPGTAHLTVRALERRRNDVSPEDPAVLRYAVAMQRASATCGRPTFDVCGLIATPGTVMAVATPTDGRAELLLETLGDELGADGWLEESIGPRDIWYLNVIHFAAAINDPDGLLEWVDAHRETHFGTFTADQCHLIRWDHQLTDGRYEVFPVTLATSSFADLDAPDRIS